MKKIHIIVLTVFLIAPAFALSQEYIQKNEFQQEKKKIYDGINAVKKPVNEIRKQSAKQLQTIDSLQKVTKEYQLLMQQNNDTLASIKCRFDDLKLQFENRKSASKVHLILAFAVILVLIIIAFVWIYFLKRKSDEKIAELEGKQMFLKDTLGQEIAALQTETRSNKELISKSNGDLNQQISNGLGLITKRFQDLEAKTDGQKSELQEQINGLKPEISKVHTQLEQVSKTSDEKVANLKTSFESKYQKFEEQIKSLSQKNIKE